MVVTGPMAVYLPLARSYVGEVPIIACTDERTHVGSCGANAPIVNPSEVVKK